MNIRSMSFALGVSVLSILAGCGPNPGAASGSAAIVGRVVAGGGVGKFQTSAQLACPDFVVTLNGSPATVTVEDDCSFLINDIQPAASYVVEVELVDLGVIGTVELTDVLEAELIEILVEADDESLTISVVRRATPDPVGELPEIVDGNNVEIFLEAGVYDTDLTVDGNNFTLVGEAGENCDDEGWTTLTGNVTILKNNATFRNIRFEGTVEVQGNNASFINVCFDGQLLIFGNNTDVNGDDDDNGNGNGDDDDDDNGDNDDGD
jgi:hypothetical protein